MKLGLPFGLDPTFVFPVLYFSLLMIQLVAPKMHPTVTPRVTNALMFLCTIDESIKGVASLRRYGITFDGNIHI